MQVVFKTKLPDNKKTNLYLLTERGLALTPLLAELALWSDQHLRVFHPILQNTEGMKLLRTNKDEFVSMLEKNYREKLAAIDSRLNGSIQP